MIALKVIGTIPSLADANFDVTTVLPSLMMSVGKFVMNLLIVTKILNGIEKRVAAFILVTVNVPVVNTLIKTIVFVKTFKISL